tara:strand:+ start:1341 stop:1595 length:255 start_codon:yes stop_codon:yes gene_type:complete
MFKKILYIIPFFIFIVFITNFYFSPENVKKVNKFRDIKRVEKKISSTDLPILKNDTYNVVVYKNDIEIYKKKRKKYKFWDLIKK